MLTFPNISEAQFIQVCNESLTMAQAQRTLNISSWKAFRRIAISLNCFKPNASGKGTKKAPRPDNHLPVNENYFKQWSPQMAYWLGFLAADGCVSEKKHRLTLVLKSSDNCCLQQLKNDLNFQGKIHEYQYNTGVGTSFPSANLTIYSRTIVADLGQYGIIPNKTYLTESYLDKIPVPYQKFFSFGFLDGDGSITLHHCPAFLGSKKDCEILNNLWFQNKGKITFENVKNNLYKLTASNLLGKQFFKEYTYFSLTHFVLPRKLERAYESLAYAIYTENIKPITKKGFYK